MKRRVSIAAVLFFCSLALFANPFLGTWEAEMIFLEVPLIFRFIDGETVSIQAVGEDKEEFVSYLLDERAAVLDLGMLNGVAMETRYEFQGDNVFILYFTESIRQEMAQDMTFSIPENSNQITRNFAESFKDAVNQMLVTTPILMGRRVR